MPSSPCGAEPIAIIGSACRFPGGASSPSRLWQLLANPRDLSERVPAGRFHVDAFYHPDGEFPGTTNSARGYFLDHDPRLFDASFFSVTPKEAEAIDPQQRLLLEVVYEALESAGYSLQQHAGARVGVFAGVMTADYDTLSQRDELTTSQYYATGNARSMVSNRLSYFFNFKGPSMTIDTACSSSLVALHQAVLSLRSGDCEMACVAGANLILTPEQFIVESSLHMLSPSGHCNMFDANADGYARGEGIAAMFVRPLSKALASGDHILAVIRETGVNSDGRTTGITMPNWEAQAQLIQDTYRRAGLDINTLEDRCQYFECHGAGTAAGDPKEARAIEHAFFSGELRAGPSTDLIPPAERPRLLVGSVKTVIGHTEGSAGLAGLFKVVESMRHDTIPPNLHLDRLNPQVAEYASHLVVPTSPVPWPAVQPGQPKRASVNSFGFGGTNAHAIVEQYVPAIHDENFVSSAHVPRPIPNGSVGPRVNRICLPLVLSAKSEKSLVAVVQAYYDHLLKNPGASTEELSWHTYARRTAFAHRVSFAGTTTERLLGKLARFLKIPDAPPEPPRKKLKTTDKRETPPPVATMCRVKPEHQKPKLLGIFTGQGAQWATMSRGLLVTSKVYRDSIRKLDEILRQCPHPPPWSLEHEISADEGLSRVHRSTISQPLCTAIQIALVDLLHSIEISFHTVVGHSSGEIGAAYAAGRIGARDAILIAYYRGMDVNLACGAGGVKGGMLVAGMSMEEAADFCSRREYSPGLCIAASNSPMVVTLSGDLDLIHEACKYLKGKRLLARILNVDTAYHSPHMEVPSIKYLEAIKSCNISPRAQNNGTAWISTVSGTGEPKAADLKDTYWRDNMMKPVLFYEAMSTALDKNGPFDGVIEVGPHCTLRGPVFEAIRESMGTEAILPYTGLLNRGMDDREAFGEFLGWIWAQFGVYNSHIRQFVVGSVQPELINTRIQGAPSYPWDHSQIHWRESRLSRQYHFRLAMPHELLGVRTRDDSRYLLRWRNILKFEKLTWARHHAFQGQSLLPASAYVIMAVDAAKAAAPEVAISVIELRDLKFYKGITFDPNSPGVEVLSSLVIEKETPDTWEASFLLTSTVADGRTDVKKNFSCRVAITSGAPHPNLLPTRPATRGETLSANPEAFYAMMAGTGLRYTGPFRGLQALDRRFDFASGSLRRVHPDDTTRLGLSPATLDSCLQTAFVTMSSPGDGAIWTPFLPVEIESIRMNLSLCNAQERSDTLVVDAHKTQATPCTRSAPASFTADIEIFNDEGKQEIQIEGLKVGSFGPTNPEDDYELYLTTQLDLDPEDAIVSATDEDVHPPSPMLAESCERVASFYIKGLPAIAVCPSPGSHLVSASIASRAELRRATSTWSDETEESLDRFILSSPYYSALNLVRRLGRNVPDVMAGILPTVFEEARQTHSFQRHISRVVKQISHKYASMHVLGLTDAELGLTEHVLAGLGTSFASYRIGSRPEENLNDRIQLSESLSEKVITEKFDFTTGVPANGQLYDLVLLSTSLFEPHNTATVLGHVRNMMRPGGFLMLIQVTRTPLEERLCRTISCALSLQSMSPTPPDWPDLLDQCGFQNSSEDSTQNYATGFSLIVRQAQSLEKALLMYPPSEDSDPERLMNRLLIVGGKQLWTSFISSQVTAALASHCGLITTVASLDDLAPGHAANSTAVILLCDLDEPLLLNMNEKRMEALKELLRPEMVILWVTESARTTTPGNSASLGFTRTLAAEIPGLTLQVLDLETVNTDPAVKAVSETFFRLAMYARIQHTSVENPLWVLEPEIHIKDGRRMVPRVRPWKKGNNRANAGRRIVTAPCNTLENVVEILPGHSGNGPYRAEEWGLASASDPPGELFGIQVNYSTVGALNTGLSSFPSAYVCLGRDTKTLATTVALSKVNASYIMMPTRWGTEITIPSLNEPVFFGLLVRYFLALSISWKARGQSLLVIEPDERFQECIKDVCVKQGISFQIFSTDEERCRRVPEVTFIHPALSRREMRDLNLPQRALVVDMLPKGSRLSEMFKATVDEPSAYHHLSSFLRPAADLEVDGVNPDAGACVHLDRIWEGAVTLSLAKMETLADGAVSPLLSVPALVECTEPVAPFSVIHWKAERDIQQIITPPYGRQLLSPSKTYLLVGLTRDFGQSLCTLLAQQGARHLVLASRNPPRRSPRWAEELTRKGVQLRFQTLDVTKMEQVTALKTKIAQTLRFPPVGGVINGAMVLDDRVFSEMSIESFQRVMAPKTIGSSNLDDAFCSPDMDFFIMTSSFAAVGGHAGQSNYAAANMYMNGLAASRRHRGFVGSILNIGVIYGLGFLHREKENLYEGLEREGYPPISERDLHHMFLEAIVAGRPTEDQIYDITTGLRRFPVGRPTLHWHSDPRFCHFTRGSDDRDEESDAGSQQLSLKEQTSRGETEEDVAEILVPAFIKRLQNQLKLAEGTVTAEQSIVELGVDSLAAVEIRSWVWRTLGHDVGVMKILSGMTISQLCGEIAAATMAVRVTTQQSLEATGVPSDASATPHTTSVVSGAELETHSVATTAAEE